MIREAFRSLVLVPVLVTVPGTSRAQDDDCRAVVTASDLPEAVRLRLVGFAGSPRFIAAPSRLVSSTPADPLRVSIPCKSLSPGVRWIAFAPGFPPVLIRPTPDARLTVDFDRGYIVRFLALKADDAPLPRARITLSPLPLALTGREDFDQEWIPGPDRRFAVYSAVTDASGVAEVRGVPEGRYVVQAWHESFVATSGETRTTPLRIPTETEEHVVRFDEALVAALHADEHPASRVLWLCRAGDFLQRARPGIRYVESLLRHRHRVSDVFVLPRSAGIRTITARFFGRGMLRDVTFTMAPVVEWSLHPSFPQRPGPVASSRERGARVRVRMAGIRPELQSAPFIAVRVSEGRPVAAFPLRVGEVNEIPPGRYTLRSAGPLAWPTRVRPDSIVLREGTDRDLLVDSNPRLYPVVVSLKTPWTQGAPPPGLRISITLSSGRRRTLGSWWSDSDAVFWLPEGDATILVSAPLLAGAVSVHVAPSPVPKEVLVRLAPTKDAQRRGYR